MTDSSWSSVADGVDSCDDVIYNATHELPCGMFCRFNQQDVFFSCRPMVYEVLVRIMNSTIGATLAFSIISVLAEVIRGYQMRLCAMQYFLGLT
eukprot:COSAG06_NODE_14356_length_1163_cov_1.455827_1_plen_93_part_10